MGCGVAENETGGFGEDYGFGVAYALLVEADAVGREGDVGVFGDVLGVDDHAVVVHATEVEDFASDYVECAEF